MGYNALMSDEPYPTDSANVSSSGQAAEFAALQTVIGALQPLDSEARTRILASVATFLRAPAQEAAHADSSREAIAGGMDRSVPPPYSESAVMSPKEFLLEKQPRTDVERIACLAFYLTYYEETPSFRTLDLSKLNMRASCRTL